MKQSQFRFSNTIDKDIAGTIRQRVNEYFTRNNISPYANGNMRTKSIVMGLIYVSPFILLISGISNNLWIMAGLWLMMAIGMAGVGFCIMHDANHSSYSAKKKTNTLLSLSMYALGGSSVNWKIQHNMLHHGFTNISGADEDIDVGKLLRLSPNQKRYTFHRFQVYYAWFLYSLMTVYWITGKDIPQMIRYHKEGLLAQQKTSFRRMLVSLLLSKVFYLAVVLGLPILFCSIFWWQTLLFFLMMHFVAGLILGLVFQPAHVATSSEFPIPDDKGKVNNNWVVHQFRTTADFAPRGRLFSWCIGGLNYQIEHHLFANVCHVHYHKISVIVREAAAEFGLPYHVRRTFIGAIFNHARMLYMLGKKTSINS